MRPLLRGHPAKRSFPAMSFALSPSSAESSFFVGLNASHWEEMGTFRDNFISLAPSAAASTSSSGRTLGEVVHGMQQQQQQQQRGGCAVQSDFFAEGGFAGSDDDGIDADAASFAPRGGETFVVDPLTLSSSASKKQKVGSFDSFDEDEGCGGGGGGFVSFNFDDIPMNEPLQFTLNSLRADSSSQDTLRKLLDIDSYDISMPQLWYDLLELLKTCLAASASQPQLYELVLKVYAYLLLRFEAHQSLEATAEVLAHLAEEMVAEAEGSASIAPIDTTGLAASLGSRTRLQLGLLCIAIKRLPKVLGDCSEISVAVERVILSLFFLLGRGRVSTAAGSVPLLDALACCKDCAAVAGVAEAAARLWSPVAVLHHSMHSGLLLVLLQRLNYHDTGETAVSSSPSAATRYLLYARLYLGFVAPFRHFRGVAEVLGSVALLETFALQWHVMRSQIRCLSVEPVAATNKLVHLMDKSNTLLPLLLDRGTSTGSGELFYELLESLCRNATAIHNRRCVVEGSEISAALSAVLSLLLQNLLHLQATEQWRGVITALARLYSGNVCEIVNAAVLVALVDVVESSVEVVNILVEVRSLWAQAYASGGDSAVDGYFSYNNYIMS